MSQDQEAFLRLADPTSATFRQFFGIKLAGPREPKLAPYRQAQANGLNLAASLQELLKCRGTQVGRAFQDVSYLLERLPDTHFAEKFEGRSLRSRDQWSLLTILMGHDVQWRGWRLAKESKPAITTFREALREPGRQGSRSPSIQTQHPLTGEVVAYTVPVERGFAADMQTFHTAFQKTQAGVKIKWAWSTKTPRESRVNQPARTY